MANYYGMSCVDSHFGIQTEGGSTRWTILKIYRQVTKASSITFQWK